MLGEKSRDELKCLKRELKAWESMFERKHDRKPSKDDVNSAPEEIRETYVKYNKLKHGSKDIKKIETQLNDKEEIEDEVFGKGLNKSRTPVSANKSVRIQISPTEYKPIKLCHGQRQKPLANKLKTNFMENSGQDVKMVENKSEATVNNSTISDDLGFSISSAKKDVLNKPGMMLGKSTLTKRMKRRSALASDWLEKNQSELAESSLNGIDPALNRSNQEDGNDSTQGFNDEFDNGNGDGSVNEELPKSNWLNAEKMSTKNLIETDNETGFQGESTVDHKSVKNCSLEESQTTGNVSTKQASERNKYKSSNLVVTDNIDVNNANLLSTTRNTIKSQSMENSCVTKSSSDLVVMHGSIGSQNVDNNSTTKRKRSKAVEASSTSDHLEPSFGDDVERKPRKKRKTSDDTYREMNIEQVENGEMEEGGETGKESEDERTQSEKSGQRNGVKKKSSGLVSENFRALNMKVRRYCRRGNGTNYAAYKRKMWKKKQQANEQADSKKNQWKKKKSNSSGSTRRISSTTTTTCFKCGEDGHWVKDCPRNKPVRSQVPAENWSEPVNAPEDLEINDEQWQATEEKLQYLVSDRLPRSQHLPSQAPPAIEPLYQPVNDQPISTPQEVYDALNKLGFDSFRCGQEEVIMQILCGLSTLVVLSTGAGKSLCYQLPAYMYSRRSPCITLVISPLVSLMEDQVVGLPFGLHGVSLNTNMTKQQRQKAVDQICSGKAAVVLVSPEALVGGNSGVGCLPHPSKLPPIAFACIDEAHCVSEWSHNFRPSYLRVCKVLRERFGVRCFLGLTATATRSTALSVCEHLGIIHRPEAIVRGATIPDNLNLSVSCDLNRDRAILELLQGSRFSDCDSIIIYCTRRDQTEQLSTYLRTCLQKNPMNTSSSITDQNGADEMEKENKEKKRGRKRKSEKSKSGKKSMSWQAECYHAGLSAAQRKKVQKKFMAGELRIVVATVAFGMGLDKADVRAVIHYNMPKSFESYVQEIGRAGRDGLPSHCHVFIDPE
ncbi:ATP-dependent DNA helicase Q4, partial [Paramuricea clavata]